MSTLDTFRALRLDVVREVGHYAKVEDIEAAGIMLEPLKKLDDAINLLTRRVPTVLDPDAA